MFKKHIINSYIHLKKYNKHANIKKIIKLNEKYLNEIMFKMIGGMKPIEKLSDSVNYMIDDTLSLYKIIDYITDKVNQSSNNFELEDINKINHQLKEIKNIIKENIELIG
jgi:hypothetical protein